MHLVTYTNNKNSFGYNEIIFDSLSHVKLYARFCQLEYSTSKTKFKLLSLKSKTKKQTFQLNMNDIWISVFSVY